jgi:hypothetical protein
MGKVAMIGAGVTVTDGGRAGGPSAHLTGESDGCGVPSCR